MEASRSPDSAIASTLAPSARLDIFSAVAACLSGFAATINNDFKVFTFVLAGVNGVLLVAVAMMRINSGLQKKKHRVSLASVIAGLCAVTLALSAWSVTHPRPVASPALVPVPVKLNDQVAPIEYHSKAVGDNPMIINGNNNHVNSNQVNDRKKTK